MNLPPEQEVIRAKCFHRSGMFIEFPKEDVELSIPERFEKMVDLFSERLAVKSKSKSFTYGELNKAANRLAREILARRGYGQEPVGLFLNDGAWLIVAHLAVVKAGKFSLGLDPSASPDRLAHLLKDSQSQLVITDEVNLARAQHWDDFGKELINIDKPSSSTSDKNLGVSISAEDYCCVRYTSGSTGSAKGGLKSHRHILHEVMIATNYFHLCREDRSMLINYDRSFGKYAFDALLNGAAVCPVFVKSEGLFRLADWLIQENITIYCFFPTAFRHFANALPDGTGFPELRLIRLEGEPIYKSDVELYRKHFTSDCILVNSFSATETGQVCLYFLNKDSNIGSTCVPAGYPVEGMQVLVLDERGKEVRPGELGEVATRSRFLSSGYWRKPDLTHRKFSLEPQSHDDPVYYTGDLGKLSDDGCLELYGRKDFQVKIRSFRVDVREVESSLAAHPQVKEVVVIGRNDESGSTRLVAYFVPQGRPAPTISNLRRFLEESYPEYMIPTVFVTLDKLPLLSTGKVDRAALPEPENLRPELNSPYVSPVTHVEREVGKIWAKVLSLDRVGIHDSFFDLGGHSLIATQIISEVFKHFKIEIPLQSLFESPTVGAMAKVIAEHKGKALDETSLRIILNELESLSDEDAERLLGKQHHDNSKA